MRYSRDDTGGGKIATIDIETTHYDPEQGETISIGIGLHERGTSASEAEYEMFHRDGDGEGVLVKQAYEYLNGLDSDILVSYNGSGFDFDFLYRRSATFDVDAGTVDHLLADGTHVDLYEERKKEADCQGKKWPKLEECVESYGCEPATTIWNGSPVTGKRFGQELGPAFLRAVDRGDDEGRQRFEEVIEHYLITDLEANFAVYYGDIGDEFYPVHLGSTATFEAAD